VLSNRKADRPDELQRRMQLFHDAGRLSPATGTAGNGGGIAMTRLEIITGGCLKCRNLVTKSDLLGADVYCKKGYSRPHLKEPSKYAGHCDYLDYDDASCAKWGDRLAFCRQHARERLVSL